MVPKFDQVAVFQAIAVRNGLLGSIYMSRSLSLTADRETAAPWPCSHSLHLRVTQLCLCGLSLYQEDTSCLSVLLNSKS